ncbi:MAG: hypothetical protein LUI04_07120, partial [Porphyromonadaceae bacterium]|nr:hypothetical protein [Porphyromonadaceae bacterium]
MKKIYPLVLTFFIGSLGLFSCSSNPEFPVEERIGGIPSSSDEDDAPDFDTTIQPYDGEMADDAALDVVGTDEDLYW